MRVLLLQNKVSPSHVSFHSRERPWLWLGWPLIFLDLQFHHPRYWVWWRIFTHSRWGNSSALQSARFSTTTTLPTSPEIPSSFAPTLLVSSQTPPSTVSATGFPEPAYDWLFIFPPALAENCSPDYLLLSFSSFVEPLWQLPGWPPAEASNP